MLECHHVTGEYTLLLKVKTANTSSLEQLITQIRSLDGVTRTETTVVLSTHAEGSRWPSTRRSCRQPRAGARGETRERNGAAASARERETS